MESLLSYIREVIGESVSDFDVQEGTEPKGPHAIGFGFSSGFYLWTFHEWAVAHVATNIAHSFMVYNEVLYTAIQNIIGKRVIDVQIKEGTMALQLFLEDDYKIIFQPSLSYAQDYCLWGFQDSSSNKVIWINSVFDIVIRDSYNGDKEDVLRLKTLLSELIGQQVCYSSCGGGVGSILLLEVKNKNCIWSWRYWSIYKGDTLLACSEDDATPITGTMAVAAHQLEGSRIKNVTLDEYTLDLSVVLDNDCRWDIITMLDKQNTLQNWEYRLFVSE